MAWQDHIAIDPDVLMGKPVVKGTRIAAELVIDLLGRGYTTAQVIDEFPAHGALQPPRAQGRGITPPLSESVPNAVKLTDEGIPNPGGECPIFRAELASAGCFLL